MKNNKRFILPLLAIILFVFSAKAETIIKESAKAKAAAFLSNGAKKIPSKKGVAKQTNVSELELAYTSEVDGKTCFYVFNNGTDGGFVIVGGDDVAKEILAYSDQGHFDYDAAPDNFKDWLKQCSEMISIAEPSANNPQANTYAKSESTTVQKDDIADMISTTWNQTDPYNRAIPKLVSSSDGSEYAPPTGCVPTAFAQIMKYWNYPEHGIGQKTLVLDYSTFNGNFDNGVDTTPTPEYGTVEHSVNFEETTYDWANMLNNYTGEETDVQINAVSTLMYHIGVAMDAHYGVSGTTVFNEDALKDVFKYSSKTTLLHRRNYDDLTWDEIIYSELISGRPIVYSSTDHRFIIHGYSAENDMYKVNWGWGGYLDCYCELSPTEEPGPMGYKSSQTALINLQPAALDSESETEFWVDGLKYSIISSYFKNVELSKPGSDESGYTSSVINVPSTVNYQGVEYNVISIGKEAFAESSNNPYYSPIEEVYLPNSLRTIEEGAFEGCGNLKSITIPDNITEIKRSTFRHLYLETPKQP